MAEEADLLWSSVGAVWLDREVLRAGGPDATGFLQGQLSQDVAGLAVGTSAWSWILQPTGKVDALLRVTRISDGDYLLDTDGGWGETLAARLNRYKLRTKIDIEPLGWRVLGLRGPGSSKLSASGLSVDASWPGWEGIDLLGETVEIPTQPDGRAVPLVGDATYQAARIGAGVPVMGAELTDRTIPAETGLVERTVSFTKGCYTGQELVARIDSRGSHVARHLRGLRFPAPAQVGATLSLEDKEVGIVTSVAESATLGWIGLAYVRRAVEPPTAVSLAGTDLMVRVEALPLR